MSDSMLGRRRHGGTGQLVQDEIKELIIRRGLAVGDPMPTEAQLHEMLGVSRNVLREALKGLQTLGIIEFRPGFGMFVGQMGLQSLVDGLSFRGRVDLRAGVDALSELVEVRNALEVGLAGRVLELMTPETDQELERLVQAMEQGAAQGERRRAEDRQFHETLYRPVGNRLIAQLLDAFWEVSDRLEAEFGARKHPDLHWNADAHRKILTALRAHDLNAIRDALDIHFTGIKEKIQGLKAATNTAPPQPPDTKIPNQSSQSPEA